jgi:hypothetical protein
MHRFARLLVGQKHGLAWHGMSCMRQHCNTGPLASRCDGRAVAIHRLELLDAEHQTTVSGRAVPMAMAHGAVI